VLGVDISAPMLTLAGQLKQEGLPLDFALRMRPSTRSIRQASISWCRASA